MGTTELFTNPTVKTVIFQIKFPNLFYLENKIGDFQQKIIKDFSNSKLLFQKQFAFAFGTEPPPSNFKETEHPALSKIWQFSTADDQITMNVKTDSLDISSEHHKTYDHPESEQKFRDIIKLAVDSFLEVLPLPIITRTGLRYIDHCPVEDKNTTTFRSWYDTTLPISRFPIEDAINMNTAISTNMMDGMTLRYCEELKQVDDKWVLILDFDGSKDNIEPKDYLETTDALHVLIADQFRKTAREPLLRYMRRTSDDAPD